MATGGFEQFDLINYISISTSFRGKSYNIDPMISTIYADKIPDDSPSHRDTIAIKKWVNSNGKAMSNHLKTRTRVDLHYSPDVYCTVKTAAVEVQKNFTRVVKNVLIPINRQVIKKQQIGVLWPVDYNHWHAGCLLIRRIDDKNQVYLYEPYSADALSFVSVPRIVEELCKALDYRGEVWVIRGTQKMYTSTCMDHLANFIYTILNRQYPEEKNVSMKLRMRAAKK
jgi:hypothetical protein